MYQQPPLNQNGPYSSGAAPRSGGQGYSSGGPRSGDQQPPQQVYSGYNPDQYRPGQQGGYTANVSPPAPARPQQPAQYYGASPGYNNNNNQGGYAQGGQPVDFFTGAAQSQAFSMGMSLANNFVEDQSKRYIPWFTALWRSLKYYFAVNHNYVLLKLKTLLFPFNKRQWTRLILDEGEDNGFSGSKHARPINDENAPDLYIPLMAFITYTLLTGYVKGTKDSFTPEVLVQICSSCMVTQLLEVFLIKLGLYFLASPVSFLDLVAFTGYKYVALNLNMLLGLFLGSVAYTVAMVYTGTCMFFVMLKTMAAAVLQRRSVDQLGPRKEYVLMMWAFASLQFLTVWWLGYSRDLKR